MTVPMGDKRQDLAVSMIKPVYTLFLAGWVLVLAACSSAPEKPAGFTVGEDSANGSEPIRPDDRTSKTVLALLDNAQQAVGAGQLHNAESQLERALRIEPRNAVLWHYMAKLRLHQNRFAEAAGFAAKSNSLAANQRSLRADNWRIIAHARQQRGDVKGAQQAQQQVEKYQ